MALTIGPQIPELSRNIAAARGPSGIASTIRSLLETAKQKGLLQDQQISDAQSAEFKGGIARQNLITQSAEQGKQARLTQDAKLSAEAAADPNRDFIPEDPENPKFLSVEGLPTSILRDKKVGNLLLKQFEDLRSAGVTESPVSETTGISTLEDLQKSQQLMVIVNPKTGERRVSNDGGQTWQQVR